ncbi:hypothetical protein FACS1894219_02670 [Clostridia bacterium]|nr:hypothetical protein FACS1894219_02670 [Clostridia bacterium]
MVIEVSAAAQGAVFFLSLIVGGALGVFYDVFRIIRVAFKPRWLSVFIQDLVFCLISAVTVILFLLHANSGRVRWFALLAFALAFVLYHMTLGRLVMFAATKIIAFIRATLAFLYSITIKPLLKLLNLLRRLIIKFARFIGISAVKTANTAYYKNERAKLFKKAQNGFNLTGRK